MVGLDVDVVGLDVVVLVRDSTISDKSRPSNARTFLTAGIVKRIFFLVGVRVVERLVEVLDLGVELVVDLRGVVDGDSVLVVDRVDVVLEVLVEAVVDEVVDVVVDRVVDGVDVVVDRVVDGVDVVVARVVPTTSTAL